MAGSNWNTYIEQMLAADLNVAEHRLALGLARACLEASVEQAKTRTSFGAPIGSRQGIAFAISDLAVDVDAARALTYQAAYLKDSGRPAVEVTRAAAVAKLFSSEAAVRATQVATQVFGGYGFMEEYPVARFYRDAKVLEIGEGTNEIQHLVIARALGC